MQQPNCHKYNAVGTSINMLGPLGWAEKRGPLATLQTIEAAEGKL